LLLSFKYTSRYNEAIRSYEFTIIQPDGSILFIISASIKSDGGRDSSVVIATRYALDSPGLELWWRRDFPHQSRPAPNFTPAVVQRLPGSGFNHPPPSSAKVKERVKLHLPIWAFMVCYMRNFTDFFTVRLPYILESLYKTSQLCTFSLFVMLLHNQL